MGRLSVGRMLATGTVVAGSTAVRVAAGGAGVAAGRVPGLVRLGVEASLPVTGFGSASGAASGRAVAAESAFRDELLGLVRELAETSWRELRRGVDDLDEFTRPRALEAPRRRHRVKA